MKIRTCFVSNSSSSSFVLIGVMFPKSDFNSKIEAMEHFLPRDSLNKLAQQYGYCKWGDLPPVDKEDITHELEWNEDFAVLWNNAPSNQVAVGVVKYSSEWDVSVLDLNDMLDRFTKLNIPGDVKIVFGMTGND